MFTGIITAVGQITQIQAATTSPGAVSGNTTHSGAPHESGVTLTLSAPTGYLDDVGLGDSIALNGACMTVTHLSVAQQQFEVDVSRESLNKTCGLERTGPVNLEKAIRANDRLGGHMVSGHVDGLGQVTHFAPVGESWLLQVLIPIELARFMAYKGSVTINGVSLTVNQVQDLPNGCQISINLIPHTVQNTALHRLVAGDSVNLEIDLIARYCERLLQLRSA